MTGKIIGVTGGIASGKSTVTGYLRSLGYTVIDADQVVHDLQRQGGRLYQALLEAFGSGILAADGELDRPKLSQLIFSDEKKLAQSSQIQDGIIREELARQRDAAAKTETLFFMDIPLLLELGYADWFDAVWLVYVDKETQIARLMARNGYSHQEAQQRIAAQQPLEEKRQQATAIIDNSGGLAETEAQVRKLVEELDASK